MYNEFVSFRIIYKWFADRIIPGTSEFESFRRPVKLLLYKLVKILYGYEGVYIIITQVNC